MSTYKLVIVEWVDSSCMDGWYTGPIAEEPTKCKSVGWLIYSGKKVTVLAPHLVLNEGDELQRHSQMSIPTCSIMSVHKIKV